MKGIASAAFDWIVSAIGLVVLAPVLLLAAIAVFLEDGEPVLFRQHRVGRTGRLFQLLKFRSMRSQMAGRSITAAEDPRLTRVGRFLRKYKIDELPQLWNVLNGDMRLVGPRPEIPRFVNLNDDVWRAILVVKPGITDLASLVYRNEEEILGRAIDPEAEYRAVILPAKLALNLHYMRSRSFGRDIRLVLLTILYSLIPSRFEAARILQAFFVQ